MLFEERWRARASTDKRGNVAFGEGGDGDGDEKEAKTREARAEYEMALSFLTDGHDDAAPPGPHADAAAAEKLPAHLNLCACFLRLGRHDDAIDQANRALIVDPKCAKAYFRRGEARRALGRDDDARADYAKANELVRARAAARIPRYAARSGGSIARTRRERARGRRCSGGCSGPGRRRGRRRGRRGREDARGGGVPAGRALGRRRRRVRSHRARVRVSRISRREEVTRLSSGATSARGGCRSDDGPK
jgi:tetratricopeptide (TPR) repeat protein